MFKVFGESSWWISGEGGLVSHERSEFDLARSIACFVLFLCLVGKKIRQQRKNSKVLPLESILCERKRAAPSFAHHASILASISGTRFSKVLVTSRAQSCFLKSAYQLDLFYQLRTVLLSFQNQQNLSLMQTSRT